MKKLSLLLLLLFTGCAGQPTTVPESETPAGRLYTARCSACHSLPHPARNTTEQWAHLLDVMQVRMKERDIPPLTDAELTAILAYLERHSR